MASDRSPDYQYIKIDNFYFCLQQSPLVFAWLLFWKRENLLTVQPWLKKPVVPWTFKYVEYHGNILRRNVWHLLNFVRHRLGVKEDAQAVQLPVYGHFGMAVHRGYKIFNIGSGVVTKIFDADVPSSAILQEIEQLQKISEIGFGPALKRWDLAHRWYQEEYITSKIATAHRAADSGILLQAFEQEALPCMSCLVSFQPPETKDLMGYIEKLMGRPEMSTCTMEELEEGEGETLKAFLDNMVERLRVHGKNPVYLVFSHGDFCPANILDTHQGMKMIDWEGAGYRSVLFDFYSYFFHRSGSQNIPVSTLVAEVQHALPLFIAELARNTRDVASSIQHEEPVYRWTFYIEMLGRLMERNISDKNLHVLTYISRYLKAFIRYEELLPQKSETPQPVL